MILKFSGLAGASFFDGHQLVLRESSTGRKRGALLTSTSFPDDSSRMKAVLVLENDAGVRDSIRRWFVNRGFELLECARPDEALDLVQQAGQSIEVAVVDMAMPVMWGDDFARHLAVISPHTKVIFISGHTEDFLRNLGSLKDGDIFFAKPYHAKELLHKVWELLGMEVPVVPAAQETPATVLDPQLQHPHFAEHLDLHIENDQCVE